MQQQLYQRFSFLSKLKIYALKFRYEMKHLSDLYKKKYCIESILLKIEAVFTFLTVL